MRALWAGTRAVVELAGSMFPGMPAFSPDAAGAQGVTADTRLVGEMPSVADADDWLSMVTRLRMVLEDPRQLLSGAVGDFAARNLVDADNDPRAVRVPGLDGEPYPKRKPDLQ